jgi:pSer/pThr/pTyr-binding forkhead associated (FHA) protein
MGQELENNRRFDLRLSVVAYDNQTPGEASFFVFQERGGSIGRGEDNDFVLHDTESVVSRTHALISYQNGQYFLTDQSTNGTFVNDSQDRLEPGEAYPLQDGDRVLVGNYLLVASLVPLGSPPEKISPLLQEKTQSPFYPALEPEETEGEPERQEPLPGMEDWPSDAQRPNWFPVGEEDVAQAPEKAMPQERPPVPVLQQHLAQPEQEKERHGVKEPDNGLAGEGQAHPRISGTGVPTGYIPGAPQFEELAGGQLLPEDTVLEDPLRRGVQSGTERSGTGPGRERVARRPDAGTGLHHVSSAPGGGNGIHGPDWATRS